MKNIYVVAAHLDDVEIGLFTYLNRLTKKNEVINISIYICSTGLDNKSFDLNKARKKVFYENMNKLRDSSDNKLIGSMLNVVGLEAIDTEFPERFLKVRLDIEKFIKDTYMLNEEDENILIYNARDIHRDHTVVNDICNVIARPITQGGSWDWNEVLNFNIPLNDYEKYGMDYQSQNNGSIFLELTKEEIKNKKEILNNYFDIGVLKSPYKKRDLTIERLSLVYKRI